MNVYILAAILILSVAGIIAVPPLVSPEAMQAMATAYDWLSANVLQLTMALSVIGMVYAYLTKKTIKLFVFAGLLLVSIFFRM